MLEKGAGDKLPKVFVLSLVPEFSVDGIILNPRTQSLNLGLSEEIVITLVRMWLKSVERDYYRKFRTQN